MKPINFRSIAAAAASSFVFALAACGGGGGSAGDTAAPTVEKPAITTPPASQTVEAGKTATFTVTATGGETLAYQWKKNGTDVSGATTSTYTTPVTAIADHGTKYSVAVSNSAGTTTSSEATLTVTAAPVVATKPAITTHPAAQTVVTGTPASFSVSASGTAPLSYQWKKNGKDIPNATSSSYTTPATTDADKDAKFSVVVTNSAGSVTSNEAKLGLSATAVKAAIAMQPVAQSVITGEMATFTVTASGTSPISYQWKKNGTDISGATSPSYTTPATINADDGTKFSVVVSNSLGTVTSTDAALTVTSTAVAPAITTQPAAQTVTEGQTATFSVTATGTAPLAYQWKKDGTDISGATSSTYTTPATSSADSGAVFSVVVTNSVSTVTSSNASLTVNVPATITVQPAALAIDAGATATFTVTATGTGTLSYQWKRNGINIPNAISNSYTTAAMSTAGSGVDYSVVVSNSIGAVTSSNARLTVNKVSSASPRYSLVNKAVGTYDKLECVNDNSTGLVWEGKTNNGGARPANDTFTNYDSTTSAQKADGSNPTQAEIDASTNSIGYVNSTNAGSGLCGFTDWRLPTKDELLGIVDTSQTPKIDNAWFTYTSSATYISSTPVAGDPKDAWGVDFTYLFSANGSLVHRQGGANLRLVRGVQ